ncbi:MAG: TonB-dependent receptor [Prolixibacteraceae bacterium]
MKKKIPGLLFFNLLVLTMIFSGHVAAQRTISGQVTDAENGDPLPGISIVVSGTTVGTVSDVDGKFTLRIPAGGNQLEFSMVGYKKQIVKLNDSDVINVPLTVSTLGLDEVVVIGYGEQSRRTMTTAVSKIDTKVLESAPRTNVGTALQGTVAGVTVTNKSGQPGRTPEILLRGGTDWKDSKEPLVLVDGVVSSFYALNQEDIQSIEVLKDAAATAIYGARAANGVVLITTKKGKAGKTEISYKYKFGMNKKRVEYDYLNAEQYLYHNRLAWKDYVEITGRTNFNSYVSNPGVGWTATGNTTNSVYTPQYLTAENENLLKEGWKKMKDPLYGTTVGGNVFSNEYIIFQDNSMFDLFFQDSYIHDHHLAVSGGNEQGTFALGLGYMDDKGIVLSSGFKNFTGNLNADYKIRPNLKVSASVNYARSSLNETYIGGTDNDYWWIFERAAIQPPTGRLYNSDGSINPGLNRSFGNPLYYKDKFPKENLEQRLTASTSLDWNIFPELKLTVKGSYFSVDNTDETFDKAFLDGGTLRTDRIAYAQFKREETTQFNALLNFSKSHNNHNLHVMGGVEYYNYDRFRLWAKTKNSPTDLIPTLNAGSEPTEAYSDKTGNRLLSALGRIAYDYQQKYLVNINLRYDGSSRLGNDKWGFFPGLSGGWNMHNEEFFKTSGVSKYLSQIKPRISYGINGNVDNLSDFGVFGDYATTEIYNKEKGYYMDGIPLLDLVWESSATLDFGLDLGLFDSRVNIIADYFIRDVKDKLAPYALPYWTGFNSVTTNNGTLRNKGFELEVNANVINQPDGLRWDVGGTLYTVRNFAKKLPDNGQEKNRQEGTQIYDPKSGKVVWVGGLQEGERVGYDLVVSHVQEYVYADEAEVAKHANRFDAYFYSGQNKNRVPGDVAWRDVDKNDTIDYRDRVVLGRTTPKLTGGFNTSLSWKGLSLYAKTDFAIGHLVFSRHRARGMGQIQGSQNSTTEVLDAWRPDNKQTDVPRFVFVDPHVNHGDFGSARTNSRYWEKGDYLCLRELTLSYDFPGSLIKPYLNSLRMYVSGSNLIYFTKYSGAMPEKGGEDLGRYPLPRVYTFGIDVSF